MQAARAAPGGEQKAALIAEVLLLPLFTALQALCADPRPEVRNSGLRTLLSTMVSHGGKLPSHLWRTCLWEILFPLLDTVRQLAAASSREESVGTQLGQDKGRAVMMLVRGFRVAAADVSLTVTPLCLPHRLSNCVSLVTVSPTVSPSPSLPLCLPRRLPHCVSLTVSPTVSLSPSPSLCLPRRLHHCVSHCVSLTVSLTASPPCL